MPGFHINELGEMVLDAIDDICVIDVYDLASDIGKECEKIIDQFGTESVVKLMPKVVNTLELLEALATKNEQENATVQELTEKIAQLESEKLEKAEFRRRFDNEIEIIEDQWRSETRELVELVSSLQEENKRILKQQQDQQSQSSDLGSSLTDSMISIENYELTNSLSDSQVLQRLKLQINKQRDEIKTKDRELQERVADIDNLNLQVERLKNSGRETRRRYKLLQTQVHGLCEERGDLLAQLQDQRREIIALRKNLGLAVKENEDLVLSQAECDSEKPCYTATELKDLITERDELLIKINNLNDELHTFKPNENRENSSIDDELLSDEDPPVQGPLPLEPDDAPWKKGTESGIRKFFRKLFSEHDSTTSFSHKSLSTLSKLALSSNNSNNTTNQAHQFS